MAILPVAGSEKRLWITRPKYYPVLEPPIAIVGMDTELGGTKLVPPSLRICTTLLSDIRIACNFFDASSRFFDNEDPLFLPKIIPRPTLKVRVSRINLDTEKSTFLPSLWLLPYLSMDGTRSEMLVTREPCNSLQGRV